MTKLNQVIALEKGVKAASERAVTNVYHQFQRAESFNGLVRTYEPLAEEDIVYPSESKKVTANVVDLLTDLQKAWTRLFDLTATKDTTNQKAKADVVVRGAVIAEAVPVSTLIWLEKRLVDFKAILDKLPVTDIAEDWTFDIANQVWRSNTVQTLRQKKVEDFITVAPATDKHAAQVVKVVKDVPEGHWNTTKLSGAASPKSRLDMSARVAELTEAVKKAREEANMTEVTDVAIGENLLRFVIEG